MTLKPSILLAADWSRYPNRRAVYKADVAQCTVKRITNSEWNLKTLLRTAREEVQAGNGPVIISLDLVLGTPKEYFEEVKKVNRWKEASNFVDWLSLKCFEHETTFWEEVMDGNDWKVEQPFGSVPGGAGSLNAYHEKAGYHLLRQIDAQCNSKCPFIVNGIPGTVGSGTRSLWQELSSLLQVESRDFKVWPFEGRLQELLNEKNSIIIAENYPGISYTSALASDLPSQKIIVHKTRIDSRRTAVEILENSEWVREYNVELSDLSSAIESEDDFDALMTAAGELRCVLENRSLEELNEDQIAEGGMLITSAVNFDLKATTLR